MGAEEPSLLTRWRNASANVNDASSQSQSPVNRPLPRPWIQGHSFWGAFFFWIFSRCRSIRIRKMVEFGPRGKRVALAFRDLDGLSFTRRPSHEDSGFCRALCEGCGQVKQLWLGRHGDSVR